MIPKKIHWCWLSGDPLPELIQECIKSWKRVMPDYEFILWDTARFDIHSVKFVEDACKARKWAFAADYIRLYALYTEGGIYLDADVMVYRRFDVFLNNSAFSGVVDFFNNSSLLEAEMIGAEKEHLWIKRCLDYYLHETVFQMDEKGKVLCEVIPKVMTYYAQREFGFDPSISIDKPLYLTGGGRL